MSACGWLGTLLNWMLITVLIVSSGLGVAERREKRDWIYAGFLFSVILGVVWVVLSTWQWVMA